MAQLVKRIDQSLDERKIVFDPKAAERLFGEAGVLFNGQLTKDFNQLIEFNRAITKERREALEVQRADAATRTDWIDDELIGLNDERARSLEYLRESDALAKYKEISRGLSALRAELATLEAKREAAARLIDLRQQQRALAEEYGHLQTAVENELEEISGDEESRFGHIRRYFTDIIFDVLGEHAVLAISLNRQGGLDFRASSSAIRGRQRAAIAAPRTRSSFASLSTSRCFARTVMFRSQGSCSTTAPWSSLSRESARS